MRPGLRLMLLLLAWMSSATVSAQAVGRTDVKDLPEGWAKLVSYDTKGLTLDGGRDNIPVQGMAFLNKSREALLIVESSVGGHGRNVSWNTMKCPATRDGYFTNDYGSTQTHRNTRCLVVNTKYASKTYLSEVSPQTAVAVEKEGLRFDRGLLLRTWSGVHGGTYLRVYLLGKQSVSQAGSAKEGASNVDQTLVDFGESLQKLVYDSTFSMNGNLSLQLLNTIK